MKREMTIAELEAAGLSGARTDECLCASCEGRGPFVGVPVRSLRVGDVVKTPVPVVDLNRCALGTVVEPRGVGTTSVKWEDDREPRAYGRGVLLVEWPEFDAAAHSRGERQTRG